MNTWIKKIHMYAGLLNFTILCVFGLAGLVATAEAPDIFKVGTVPVVTTLPFRAPGSAKADVQKGRQASPDDGDALALTFAQPVQPGEVEEEDEEEEFGRYTGSSSSGGWMR
jgi:hypothetical protein